MVCTALWKLATWAAYGSLVIAQFVVEASITAVIMTETWKTNKHIMYSHSQYVRCVIGFWPVFKQFLNCIIGVDTCLAILFGVSQEPLELHGINRALLLHPECWLLFLGSPAAHRTGRAHHSPSLEIHKVILSEALSTPVCLWSWHWFEQVMRPDFQRYLANDTTRHVHTYAFRNSGMQSWEVMGFSLQSMSGTITKLFMWSTQKVTRLWYFPSPACLYGSGSPGGSGSPDTNTRLEMIFSWLWVHDICGLFPLPV